MSHKILFALVLLVPGFAQASGSSVGNGRVACREGSIETFNESRGEGEPSATVSYACHGGRLVIISAAAAASVRSALTCREGDRQHWVTETSEGAVGADYVCHSGQYVPSNP